jgi:prepilin-type N-terminal cleavage/methylation domain-containing protein
MKASGPRIVQGSPPRRRITAAADQRGLTLPEIIVAMAILTIGLVGVAGALVVASGGVAGGISRGQGAIEHGYAVSTATLLAQDWVEQIRRLVPTGYRCGTACGGSMTPIDTIGNPPAGFSAQAFGDITGYPNFSRSVTVTANSPAANMKTVTVTVRYKYSSGAGMIEEGLGISTIIAARP